MARSSSEAEYRGLATTSCELQWLTFLLRDLHVQCSKPSVLYCDNKSALHIAANQVFHERTKHLDIDCHVVREHVSNGLFKLLPIPSADQLVDLFTKGLLPRLFFRFLSKLGLFDIFNSQLRGGINLVNNMIGLLFTFTFLPFPLFT